MEATRMLKIGDKVRTNSHDHLAIRCHNKTALIKEININKGDLTGEGKGDVVYLLKFSEPIHCGLSHLNVPATMID